MKLPLEFHVTLPPQSSHDPQHQTKSTGVFAAGVFFLFLVGDTDIRTTNVTMFDLSLAVPCA